MSGSRQVPMFLSCIVEERGGIIASAVITALVVGGVVVAVDTGTDVLLVVRLSWTVLTFVGTVRVSLNLREALLDLRAVVAARKDGARLIQSQGAVFDQGLKAVALGADCLAGLMALAGLLIPTVALLCIGALMLVNLSFAQERRRKRTLAILDVLYKSQLDLIQLTVEDTNQQVTDIHGRTIVTDASNDARMTRIEDTASAAADVLAQKERAEHSE